MDRLPQDSIRLFEDYMRLYGTPSLSGEAGGGPLAGKVVGIVNGSSWVTLWSMYFGRRHLPGVKLVNVGNEAVQLNFMAAHHRGGPVPPPENIECFRVYAEHLMDLYRPDVVLLTCSTMNRAAEPLRQVLHHHGIPLVQIDEAMMEAAVKRGGRTLVIATHGPTVASTQALLRETAERLDLPLDFEGSTVEDAFELLGEGRIKEHNERIAEIIRSVTRVANISSVVLAQLSMSIFTLSYPDAEDAFGIPVYTSGDCGFQMVRDVLMGQRSRLQE